MADSSFQPFVNTVKSALKLQHLTTTRAGSTSQLSAVQTAQGKNVWLPNLGVWAMLPTTTNGSLPGSAGSSEWSPGRLQDRVPSDGGSHGEISGFKMFRSEGQERHRVGNSQLSSSAEISLLEGKSSLQGPDTTKLGPGMGFWMPQREARGPGPFIQSARPQTAGGEHSAHSSPSAAHPEPASPVDVGRLEDSPHLHSEMPQGPARNPVPETTSPFVNVTLNPEDFGSAQTSSSQEHDNLLGRIHSWRETLHPQRTLDAISEVAGDADRTEAGCKLEVPVHSSSSPSSPDATGHSASHAPTCPICLGPLELHSKAVLRSCLHSFCMHCIEKWSQLQRLCPLCKGEFTGWYYNIRADSQYDEKSLPPLKEKSLAGTSSGALSDHPLEWAYSAREPWRYSWRSRRTPRGQHRQRPEEERSGPRPYFYRLQRGLRSAENSAQANRTLPLPIQRSFGQRAETGRERNFGSAAGQRLAEDGALRWRRSIYETGLRALPLEVPGRTTAGQVRGGGVPEAEARQQRRVEAWIRRDLQALLGEPDPLLVHFVLGLWTAHGRQRAGRDEGRPRPPPPAGGGRKAGPAEGALVAAGGAAAAAAGAASTRERAPAVEELERFLGTHAGTFWHELRSFAESPLTMQAYDTVVRYPQASTGPRPLSIEHLSAFVSSHVSSATTAEPSPVQAADGGGNSRIATRSETTSGDVQELSRGTEAREARVSASGIRRGSIRRASRWEAGSCVEHGERRGGSFESFEESGGSDPFVIGRAKRGRDERRRSGDEGAKARGKEQVLDDGNDDRRHMAQSRLAGGLEGAQALAEERLARRGGGPLSIREGEMDERGSGSRHEKTGRKQDLDGRGHKSKYVRKSSEDHVNGNEEGMPGVGQSSACHGEPTEERPGKRAADREHTKVGLGRLEIDGNDRRNKQMRRRRVRQWTLEEEERDEGKLLMEEMDDELDRWPMHGQV